MHAVDCVPPYIRAAVSDPARSQDASKDARRKMTDVMVFSAVKPGQKVLELIPGTGYFTRVFSGIVGTQGHMYALWPNEDAKEMPATLRQPPSSPLIRIIRTSPCSGSRRRS